MKNEKLFTLAREKGLDDIQIVNRSDESLSLVYFNGKVERNESSAVTTVKISAVLNGQKAVFSVEDENMPEEDIIDRLYDIASHMSAAETTEIFAGSESYPDVICEPGDFHRIPITQKIAILAEIERKLREKEPRIAQIPELGYDEEVSTVTMCNSKGLNISKHKESCDLFFELVASDGKEAKTGFSVEIKKNLADIDVDQMIDDAIREAVGMFDARPVESGTYPVIVENKAMVSLLSSFAAMFTGESQLKKISLLQGKLGSKVFSDKISFIDAPLKEDAVNREPFDDEGVACRNKTVIDKGVFANMLHDLKTAKAFGAEPTGNAFRGGILPCNGYLVPGTVSKDEMIASTEKGLLLTGFDGLHAGLNPISGDMSLKTEGYLIEDGKIVRPVTLIILAGNFLQMMNDVEEVGSDLKFRGLIGAPSVKFGSVSISG